MIVKIVKPALGGTVRAIASKSHTHRLLICTALSEEPAYIECLESSGDIEATVEGLSALGAEIQREGSGYYVNPIPKHTPTARAVQLDCGESGSTFRFLLPVVCALGVPAEFVLRGRLPVRPIAPLTDELTRHGCEISGAGTNRVRVSGKLRGGKFMLPGDVSSQFISGLLFALPILGGSEIYVDGTEESKSYTRMTLDALSIFGVKIRSGDGFYAVDEPQRYSSPVRLTAEGDWSSAAFWLCLGACAKNGGVTCTGLNPESLQGDRAVTLILQKFGASVETVGESVRVKPSKLRGVRLDAADTPDLVPVLAAAASVAEGETVIYGAARLRVKESNRLRAVTETLNALGADVRETEDGLVINGKPSLKGGTVSSYGDHRIAMTAAVASAFCCEPVTIINAEAVKKSYPGFFEDFCGLGGEILEVD